MNTPETLLIAGAVVSALIMLKFLGAGFRRKWFDALKLFLQNGPGTFPVGAMLTLIVPFIPITVIVVITVFIIHK